MEGTGNQVTDYTLMPGNTNEDGEQYAVPIAATASATAVADCRYPERCKMSKHEQRILKQTCTCDNGAAEGIQYVSVLLTKVHNTVMRK